MKLKNDRLSDKQLLDSGRWIYKSCGDDEQRIAKRTLEYNVGAIAALYKKLPSKIVSPKSGRTLLELRDILRDKLDRRTLNMHDINIMTWYRKNGIADMERLANKPER